MPMESPELRVRLCQIDRGGSVDGRTVDQLGSARSCIGACRPKTPHCSDHSIAGSIKGLMQKPRSRRPSIAASARANSIP